MAKNIYDEWDKAIDTEGLAKDVEEAAENGGNYKEVPHGDYEVAIQQMELKPSKAGDPMLSVWFKVVSEGEFKGCLIFYNQVITQGFQLHIANQFLRSITTTKEVKFENYKQYANLVMDIFEEIDNNYEFALKYGKGKKDFSTYEITEVFPLED